MTPTLLRKIGQLLRDGATVIGKAPRQSPSLSGYPKCDDDVRALVDSIWGSSNEAIHAIGKGRLIVDTTTPTFPSIYSDYGMTEQVLKEMGISPDFDSDVPLRYIHRRTADQEIYFVANSDAKAVSTMCRFRATGKPQWWQPLTAEYRDLPQFTVRNGVTSIALQFDPAGSGFVIFASENSSSGSSNSVNFPTFGKLAAIDGPWELHFDPTWGGPDHVTFDQLDDWAKHPEPGIRSYSGKAVYKKSFPASADVLSDTRQIYISLADVRAIAAVRLNGVDLGTVWCAPWRLQIPSGTLKAENDLEITVANLWCNRLIADAALPADQRLTKTTWNPFKAGDALEPSGLLGPVELQTISNP
jgi:hypothetical protein